MLQTIPTNCKSIDKALGSGLPIGDIGLVYGEPETGKTTLAIQCTISCAKQSRKTLFVDGDGTFSVQRLSQIAADSFKEISELIILMKPTDFQEQGRIVDKLPELVTKNFGLVVFDTVTALYRAKVAESTNNKFELNRELNRQLACLAQSAKTQKIAVLITSQVHTSFRQETVSIEPVATRVLKFWSTNIISLKPTENPTITKAILEKTKGGSQPNTSYLKIDQTGIHEY